MKRLRVALIPTAGGYLLLPQSILNQIYPYAPALSIDQGSEFLVGCILIQNEKLPLLNFDFESRDQALPKGEETSNYHFVLVQTISTRSPYRSYAVLARGMPQIFELNEQELSQVKEGDHRYIAQYVQFPQAPSAPIMILNLEALESELSMN